MLQIKNRSEIEQHITLQKLHLIRLDQMHTVKYKSYIKSIKFFSAAHIMIFFLLLCSSSIATTCIYYILDMYRFNCIIYAKISFEQTYEERLKDVVQNETAVISTESSAQKHTTSHIPDYNIVTEEQPIKRFKDLFSEERESGAKLDCINGKESYSFTTMFF